MKKIFIAFVGVSAALTSCDFVQGFVKGASKTEDSSYAKEVYIAERDQSITAENAYSTLFLDSAALESFITSQKLNDTTARRMRSFYNDRNYQFAWFTNDGFTEQGRGFWNRYDGTKTAKDSLLKNDALAKRMDTLMEQDTLTVAATDTVFAQTELVLTRHFVDFAAADSMQTSAQAFYLPKKKWEAMQMADSIIRMKDDSTSAHYNKAYAQLKTQLQQYYTVAQNGGWQSISGSAATLQKGASAPIIAAIKKRLAQSGDWSGNDTTQVYHDSLFAAIQSFQQRHGFTGDGIISDSLIAVMNIPAQQRLEQILVNMNRMHWAAPVQQQQLIEVNIPEFMLHVYEGQQKTFDMPVVVGKEGNNTLMFDGNLNQVVFSPAWNIPASIVQQEIMPAMKTDPTYLKKRNMEIVGKSNDSVPSIRQLPGAQNSLGKVKFLFPNTYDIYLHDTPAKDLFAADKRAFSHGCIRVADAEKLAQHLLRNESAWTPEKIKAAMNSGKEQTVALTQPVPVMISYYTVWVDDNGKLNFRDDVYGHDERTRRMLFTSSSI